MLDQQYWNNRYLKENNPWDAGAPTTPLKRFIDQLENKDIRILVPGAGFAHEAIYLFQQGFHQTFICDWSEEVLKRVSENNPDFPKEQLICGDFFKLDLSFDLIIEQTFFCAMDPGMRPLYIQKTHQLLNDGGQLVGLLWAEHFEKPGPPFGGTKEEYSATFSPLFDILELELTPWSISPRTGRELFFRFQKK